MNKTLEWKKARAILRALYHYKGITRCEMCNTDDFLSWAHRHKRHWYNSDPELLAVFEQTLLLCVSCHQKIEYDKKLTEKTFNMLRGEE